MAPGDIMEKNARIFSLGHPMIPIAVPLEGTFDEIISFFKSVPRAGLFLLATGGSFPVCFGRDAFVEFVMGRRLSDCVVPNWNPQGFYNTPMCPLADDKLHFVSDKNGEVKKNIAAWMGVCSEVTFNVSEISRFGTGCRHRFLGRPRKPAGTE